MHGDFTGGIGSMAWLGLASAGVGGLGGRGLAPAPPADFPMYVSVTVCSVCVCTFGCCCMVILRGELAAWLGLACLHVGVYICMYAVMLGLYFKIHVAICI